MLSRSITAIEGHTGGPLFYVWLLLKTYLPWILAFVISLAVIGKRQNSNQRYKLRIFLIFAVVCFLFYSIVVQTKLDWYILPVYPAVSLVIGGAVSLVVRKWQQLALYVVAGLLMGGLVIAVVPRARLRVTNFVVNSYGGLR